MHPKKLIITFPADFTFTFFGSNSSGEVHYFDCSFVSDVMVPCFRPVMNRKLGWNISKHCFEIIIQSRYGPQWANAALILPITFSYPIVHAKLKSLCHVICLNKLVHFHSSRSVKTISWILSMISGVAASIRRPERGASHVNVRSCLNSSNCIQSLQMCYEHYPTRLWFLSALNLFKYVW